MCSDLKGVFRPTPLGKDENVFDVFQTNLDTACWNSYALMEKLISAVAEI